MYPASAFVPNVRKAELEPADIAEDVEEVSQN
jgi:hypothetical protein